MNKSNKNEGSENGNGWDAWDAVPRDGPAVFVIDTGVLDGEGRVYGRWIDLAVGRTAVLGQLNDLLGVDPTPTEWAIVDQVGLGDRMAPEVVSPDEMATLPAAMAAEATQ